MERLLIKKGDGGSMWGDISGDVLWTILIILVIWVLIEWWRSKQY